MCSINFNVVTIQDCLDMYEKKNTYTIINDGRVVGFGKEVENDISR